MAYFRKENVTLQETDASKIKELKAQGFKEIPEPKKVEKKATTKKAPSK